MSVYTNSELEILKDNIPPDNFIVSSLDLVNSETGTVIEDALHIDNDGNFVLKDNYTHMVLKNAVTLLTNIVEFQEKDEDDFKTLYFIDKNNSKVSLGEIYQNLFINKSFSGDRWYTSYRNLNLDYTFDEVIKDNFYNLVDNENIDPDGNISIVKDYVENHLSQSNVWHSLPIEVITDDYVSNKYGIITANIPLLYRSTQGTNTTFRIFDATAGIELCRTSIFLPSNSTDTVINIPLSYQGILPDSPIAKNASDCSCITIEDLDNLELLNGKDKGNLITKDQEGFYLVPVSKHVIKIQWQTCDIIEDYIRDSKFRRQVVSDVPTTLSVDIYNNNQVNDEFMLLGGSFFIGDINSTDNTYTIDIDTTKYNFGNDYVVTTGTSKNVFVSIISKDENSFTLRWDKNNSDCEVFWRITKTVKGKDEDLTELSNRDRETNYTIFKNKLDNVIKRNNCDSLDLCTESYGTYQFAELLPTTPITGSTTSIPDDELVDGLKEYAMLGYTENPYTLTGELSGSKTIQYYKSIDIPEYDYHFHQPNDEYGTWRISGKFNPGDNLRFSYLPNTGYCPQEQQTYKLPISTVRVPKIKCNLCEDVDITYTLVTSVSGVSTEKPIDCGKEFFHVTDSFGNTGYSYEDNFLFQVELDTEDTTCVFEISGSGIVGTDETVTVLKKITYDDTAYGNTFAISGGPSIEIGMFDPSETPSFEDTQVAFPTSDNSISLNVDYDEDRYARYFSPSNDRILKTTTEVSSNGYQFNYFVIPTETFLGQESFGYQVVLFDPFLTIDPVEGELPLFPNYDPIGNKSSLEEITEYINSGDVYYTNENFVPFPNFTIGSVTIDGKKYNPLLDYRNYRVVGTYNTYFGETVFQTKELGEYNLTQNSIIEMNNGERYKVINDGSNTGNIDIGIINGIDVKTSRSGFRMVPITDLFWDTFVSIEGTVISF